MQRIITRSERDYAELLERAQKSLVGKWVRNRADDTGKIREVFVNTGGLSCTVDWSGHGVMRDQKFSRDFFPW